MLNSPNRDGGGPGHLSRRVFRQSCTAIGSKERAVLGLTSWKCFTVASPLFILLWAPMKKQLFLVKQHRRPLFCCPGAAGPLLQFKKNYAQHLIPGCGLTRPDLE